MKTDLGISQKHLQEETGLLGFLLSDAMVLLVKTKKYHWNVQGPEFYQLHNLFQEQYKEQEAAIDDIAERIRALGAYAPGSMKAFLKHAHLSESAAEAMTAKEMLADLLDDHAFIIKKLRTAIVQCDDVYKDAGTADFLTGLLKQHEKMAWMLSATLS